jgi:hypothetical protein
MARTAEQQRQRAATQRAYRKRTGNAHTRAYEKSPNGFLMRAYRNMLSRVTGVQWRKAHLYKGLPVLPREEFYCWSRNNPDFWRLYRTWCAAGYLRALTPSINRIDTRRGYTPGNMEWVTHSVNSSLANHSRGQREALERLHASL